MRAAMIGGGAYVAGKHMQRGNEREDDQEQRLEALEADQGQAQEEPASNGADVVSQLQQLKQLRDAGALSPEEFDTAKTRLLAG